MLTKIYCINTSKVHEVELKNSGENTLLCPECSHTRKKNKLKCLGFNAKDGVGHCNHCDSRFVEYRPLKKQSDKQYKLPTQVNLTQLSDNAVKWFTNRMIGQEALNKMQVSTSEQWFPQVEKERNCIAFPYYRNGQLVNVKYRDGEKNFKMESGAELIWWNYDAILKHKEIIIVEGEIDALSFIQEGFENVISVPNGANAVNMPYLESSLDDLEKIEKFYIATDIDDKGLQLRDELVRRLGQERCVLCSFEQYKDANEYLTHKGYKSLENVLKNAKEIKIDDVFEAKDFFDEIEDLFKNGLKPGLKIDFAELDQSITWETKRLAVVTGAPGSGKSELVDDVLCRLNILYDWKTGYYSPENFPVKLHYAKLHEKLTGKRFGEKYSSADEFYTALEYIHDNFFWVAPPEDFTVDDILKKFEYLVKRKGIKACVIDPFNRIDKPNGQNKLDAIAEILIKLSNFAKKHDVLMILIAHPRKLEKDKGGFYPIATMYDIAGSADFWNMCDYGISVGRDQDAETKKFQSTGIISIQKVKFKHLGKTDIVPFKYNYNNGRYEGENTTIHEWDNSNWIRTKYLNLGDEILSNTKIEPSTAFSDDEYDDFPF
ncbi:bifunctional DNA primase/helicase [Riemerella anatipestifer]|nr:bifunctional DNA primase/helicase [Riemerella anatipestifer]UXN81028.1 bifunctional DNA primase/helicase [Phage vB_RanS_PJN03]